MKLEQLKKYDPTIPTWVSVRNPTDAIIDRPYAIITKTGTIPLIKKQIKTEYGPCYIAIVQDSTGYSQVIDIT